MLQLGGGLGAKSSDQRLKQWIRCFLLFPALSFLYGSKNRFRFIFRSAKFKLPCDHLSTKPAPSRVHCNDCLPLFKRSLGRIGRFPSSSKAHCGRIPTPPSCATAFFPHFDVHSSHHSHLESWQAGILHEVVEQSLAFESQMQDRIYITW